MSEPLDCTEDRLLGGRVLLRQPRRGLRAGLDAVLLAAGVPARPGQRVLEAGCGSGAGFLCLAARVPDLTVIAIERDPALAALALANAHANGLAGRVEVIAGDVRDLALAGCLPRCDHAFANPPYWPEGTPPPDPLRRAATHARAWSALGSARGSTPGSTVTSGGPGPANDPPGLPHPDLSHWARFLAASVVGRGAVTLILPAARLEDGLAAVTAAGCSAARLVPFWPRQGEAAKRLLLQARLGARGPARLSAGLVLHAPDGAFTAAADRILREAGPLPD